jgi:hypothetical protein
MAGKPQPTPRPPGYPGIGGAPQPAGNPTFPPGSAPLADAGARPPIVLAKPHPGPPPQLGKR